ncbi:MAG: PEP-CTERM sorting domain-containing protein [bacterium]|nr:PEP-CTERM sorting domain-containing protein [bacterium]
MAYLRAALFALVIILLPATFLPATSLAGPFNDVPVPMSTPSFWANSYSNLVRGLINPTAPGAGLATAGSPSLALGPATGAPGDIVSLGNGGTITLGFNGSISDGPGADFAIFENGFEYQGDIFGELAFVEVSSDGLNFAMFGSISLNSGPLGDFDPVDVTNVHNLAGQFVAGFGSPFDLSDLSGDPLVLAGQLDLSDVRYVRLTDVVGDGSTIDSAGNPIYDPFPTVFSSSGFDLEAVGVINRVDLPEPSIWLLLATSALVGLTRRR